MNHILGQGILLAEHVWVLGLMTVLFLACFLGWVAWAYSGANRERMNEAARMPLLEDDA